MILDLVPLICLGNMTMATGMVSFFVKSLCTSLKSHIIAQALSLTLIDVFGSFVGH